VVGHGRGLLERAAVFEIRRDACGAEAVVADESLDAGRRGAAADHGVRIGLGQGSAGELAGAADGTEQRTPRIRGQAEGKFDRRGTAISLLFVFSSERA